MGIACANLDGHVALITGGRRGIGRAIARRLAAHGCAVVVAAHAGEEEGLAETLELIGRTGGTAASIIFDLGDEASRCEAVAAASEHFGAVDILVNNAALNPREPPSSMDYGSRRLMFEVNFHGPIDLIHQALPAMRAKGWGRILHISSDTARQAPIPYIPGSAAHVHGVAIYGASKAALDRHAEGLAAELHGTGIHVNGVLPQKVCITEMNSDAALAALRVHPEWAEPVEMMAEAAYLMIAGSLTGLILSSRETLQMMQQPLHALDGRTIIGDAATIPDWAEI